ncbi:MAG: 3-hydroxyacyl-CoA dehydrogenase [Xanthomonadales bacterium]|nr:enoyl-CoA hydratase/isomerase family protein [Gammaproteobacteria bacterium]MBT8052720.1 enoyl-CoA hydratase/isomerase family protein [Gammaproteobacteria bacterium]NND57382.1 3-hydroxyacyl-CoA dehydrogenase [Xanthomonadales bacterium]NNK50622.1 3-hydroxyacyl-CoA dehydrogenase [Xanthomonadales bacterium]
MSTTEYRNWRLEHDLDKVCWLTIDREGESSNSLSQDVLTELAQIVTDLEKNHPRGLVLQSGKNHSFIVGADVREFDQVKSTEEAEQFIREVHRLFDRVEALPFPTAVIIDGYCLGGGLELALCFDYRVAANIESTRLGFPEVKLGIYPGFGGSARTTRQIGGFQAMQIMLTGRMLRAHQAKGLGLVDQLVGPHGGLRWAARNAVLKGRKSRGPGRAAKLTNSGPARKFLAGQMRKQTSAKANPAHYPAPFELIDAWEECGDDPRKMLNEEAVRVARLINGSTSKGLRRVFSLMEQLKSQGKGSDFKARRVHVIGAGVMGGDIAAWCVLQGLEVTLQDREMKYIEPALKRAKKLFAKRLKTADRIAGAQSRLIADVEGTGAERADVIIEAIFENLEAKQKLFEELESRVKPTAILATNTSAIPLKDIASVLKKPARLVGLHFFNPVAKMPLVEVVYDKQTRAEEIERGSAFCNQINRFPLPVRSSPGFLVNRVLARYMLKAFQIHREREVPKEALDKAAERFGMPMGPVELADTVGLDVGLGVMGTLGGEEAGEEAALLKALVDQGKLGKKSGEGFYVWKKGRAQKDSDAVEGINLESLAQELMQPYFDECRACLADGIVKDSDAVDAGMIFGTGFAPFRGGPLFYLENSSKRSEENEDE